VVPSYPEAPYTAAPLPVTVAVFDTSGRIVQCDWEKLRRDGRYFRRIVSDPRAGETVERWFAGLVDTGQLPPAALVRSFELGTGPEHRSEIAYFVP